MTQWKDAGELSDLVQPTKALQSLLGAPFEITLKKDREGLYRGETVLLSPDGLTHRAFLEAASLDGNLVVSYERLPLARLEQGDTSLDGVTAVFLQYRQVSHGIEVLGLSSESCIGVRKPVPEREVPPSSPPPSPSPPEPARRIRRRAPRAAAVMELGVIDPLLESNPALYLARGIEKRMRAERVYDAEEKKFRFTAVPDDLYSIDDYLSIADAALLMKISKDAMYQRIVRPNPTFVKHRDKPGQVKIEDLVYMSMIEISRSKKQYEAGEIAGFFGIDVNDVAALMRRGYFTIPKKFQAGVVQTRFRESFDVVVAALREGKSLLEESVSVEPTEDLPRRVTPVLLPDQRYDYYLHHKGEERLGAVRQFLEVYQDEFHRRLLESLIAQGTINGNNILLGKDQSQQPYAATMELSIETIGQIYDRKPRDIRRRICLLPKGVYRQQGADFYISPLTALGLYNPFEKPNLTPSSVGFERALQTLLLDEQKDHQLVTFLQESRLATSLAAGSPHLILEHQQYHDLHSGLFSSWAVKMANADNKKKLFSEIGYVDENKAIEIMRKRGIEPSAGYLQLESLREYAVLGMISAHRIPTAAPVQA